MTEIEMNAQFIIDCLDYVRRKDLKAEKGVDLDTFELEKLSDIQDAIRDVQNTTYGKYLYSRINRLKGL